MQKRQSSGVAIPSPLRVIKRGKSMQVLSPRKFSSDSFDGPDQPLTVVKSRKSKASGMNQSSNNELEAVHDQSSKENQRSAIRKTASCLPWDPVTPKPRKVSTSRRSSSFHVGRPLSPTFLNKLRSLSTRRSLSSKTTRRQNDSRVSSGYSDESSRLSGESVAASSYDQSSAIVDSRPPSYLDEFETSSFGSNSFANDRALDAGICDPYMLIPHISITSEAKTLNEGQSSVWMAVEISGQLSHPRTSNSTHDSLHGDVAQPPFIPAHHCDPSLSSVVDLIGDTTISTISPGCSLLMLACIRLGAPKGHQPRVYQRNSESLISDIEFQLGNVKIEYAQVRLSYGHSGFPAFQNGPADDGTSLCHTRLETVTTGIINRYNPVSPWSPQPTPISNPLFAIIASHWGPLRANDVMHRIMSSRPSRRKAAHWMGSVEDTIRPPSRTGTAPPVPGWQGSLRRLPPHKIADPARQIWTELRQTSGDRPASRMSKANRMPAATTFADQPPNAGINTRPGSARPESKLEVHRQRELIRETAVRNKRSIGTDSLKSLVPSVPEANPECKENYVPDSPSPPGKQDAHFDGRKREGRWSLGSWWQ
ncbi:hypothetical protein F4818DRAFT_457502 [Hypoxylon cercidicola]|nr:hypothetical protein F4818DRAFT_457502 [Hypoxylon cercidicola]